MAGTEARGRDQDKKELKKPQALRHKFRSSRVVPCTYRHVHKCNYMNVGWNSCMGAGGSMFSSVYISCLCRGNSSSDCSLSVYGFTVFPAFNAIISLFQEIGFVRFISAESIFHGCRSLFVSLPSAGKPIPTTYSFPNVGFKNQLPFLTLPSILQSFTCLDHLPSLKPLKVSHWKSSILQVLLWRV